MVSHLVAPERVRPEVQPVHLGRFLASLLLSFFYVLGFLAAWVGVGLGYAVASARLGWRDVYTRQERKRAGAA
jgi:hypothetical protein